MRSTVIRPYRRAALWTLLALSWLLPLVVLIAAGWRTWQLEVAEAENRIRTTLRIVEEHVLGAFEAQVLVLNWLNDRVSNLSWDEIGRSQSLYDLMALVGSDYDHIASLFMADSTGRVRINDKQFPLERNILISDRDYFQALARDHLPLFVSEPYPGRWNGAVSFRVVRPRVTREGKFDGLIAASVHVDYYERLFRTAVGSSGNALTLMREDGAILARYPQLPLNAHVHDWRVSTPAIDGSAEEIRPLTSPLDGIARLVGSVRLPGYPLVLSYGIDKSIIFHDWFGAFALYSGVALISAITLSAITLLALMGERRESAAIAAWQDELARRLDAEAETQRMSKYEALGTLAGGIAHHFNNLLPALTGHLEIAIKEAGATSPAMPRLQRLLREIGEARKIIRDILLFSRRDVTAFRSIDLSDVVVRTVDLFSPTIQGTVTVESDIAPGIRVIGDPSQLAELATNLLSNAHDALQGKGGRITVSVRKVHKRAEVDGRKYDRLYAEIKCADTGEGMPHDVLERAFDPFFTTKPAGSGSGLGLAICDGIVQSHGGTIAAESAKGKGTAFTILIPLAPEEEG